MIKKVIIKERRNGSWAIAIKIPKVTNKIKRSVALWGIPDNLNESEAEAIGQALTGMTYEKQSINRKVKHKQMSMRLKTITKTLAAMQGSGIDLNELAVLVAEKLKEPRKQDQDQEQAHGGQVLRLTMDN